MRVVIADDHSVVRVGLRILINASRRCVIVGEADSVDNLMNLLSSTSCELLITDFSMPGGLQADGLKMLSTIQRHYPTLPIILVTMFTSVVTARAALAQGVMGIVAKTASATELPLAINAVQEGRRYLSKSLRTLLANTRDQFHESPLSAKEHEVVRMLASGMTVSEIAAHFNRSVSTISKQKKMAMLRLGISTDVDLFSYARDSGMT
ncbi:response regulator containing a CheY-like receiver domain and an HTH DNA-binding domain [Pseudomonas sp. GM33]|uniref:response regulator n=1 Tax=Pseudomonas sp. GM33 TaxID=1144329 RepID=UPI0002701AC8|nr:response regulator [Pseudomonas sp. GM33]EJM45180.1 response regulator containing a CheY-like receiver domain and an HTH DNA-binding domain [Pseudomonas sp. GM33]MDP9655871.1 two-component system capsular synthesis response regulator RcsB [Pseudomonas putida]